MDAATPLPDFDAMCTAIVAAGQDAMNPDAEDRIDLFKRAIREVRLIRADAMKARIYSARDPEVRRKAKEVRGRAERRLAQFLMAMDEAGLRDPGHPKKGEKGRKASAPSGLPTLTDLGVGRRESQDWQKLARMSDAEFEAWLETELNKKSQRRSRRANTDAPPGGAGALVPIRPGIQLPGTVTRTGWKLPKDMSFDDWLTCGQVLDLAEGAVQWWRGDWWAFGSGRQWGEGEALAEKVGVNYGTLTSYGSVARAFDFSDRSEKLTFSHHLRVMAAPAEERQAWLRRAETEGWSVAELRAALAQGKRLKVARQAELDGEKDGPQSEPTPFDQGPSPSPQTPPEPESAAEPVVEQPAPSKDDARSVPDLAPAKIDAAPPTAPGEPGPPPDLYGLHCAAVLDTIRGTIRGLTNVDFNQVATIPTDKLLEVRSELDEAAGALRAVITRAIESAGVGQETSPPAGRGVREC
jgi:hypothetical protein